MKQCKTPSSYSSISSNNPLRMDRPTDTVFIKYHPKQVLQCFVLESKIRLINCLNIFLSNKKNLIKMFCVCYVLQTAPFLR